MKRFKRFISKLTLCAMFVQIMSFGILGNTATTYASESEILDEPIVVQDILYDIDVEPIINTTYSVELDRSIMVGWQYDPSLLVDEFTNLTITLTKTDDMTKEFVPDVIENFIVDEWQSNLWLDPGVYAVELSLNKDIVGKKQGQVAIENITVAYEYIEVGTGPLNSQWFAENVEIFAENPQAGGKIKLEVKDVADITEPLPGSLMAFGQYWVIKEHDTDIIFNPAPELGQETKVTIRVWFTANEIEILEELKEEFLSIYYYYVDEVDGANNRWMPFGEISVETTIAQDYIDRGFIGYVQAVTTHFTDFTPVAYTGPYADIVSITPLTHKSFLIDYKESDEMHGIDYVNLYYSLNGADFVIAGQYTGGQITFNATENGTYRLYVEAVNKNGDEQQISADNIKEFIVNVPTPSAPTNFKTVKTNGEIWLSWDGMGAWVDEYEIWMSNDANFSSYQIFRTNQTSYLIKGLLEGKRYFFKVKAVSLGGTSEFSASSVLDIAGPSVTPPSVLEEILTTPEVQAQPAPVIRDEEILEPPAVPEEEEVVVEEEEDNDNARWIITIIILLLAAGAGVGGYYGYLWWQDRGNTPPPSSVKVTKKSTDQKVTKTKTATKRKSARW